jgi:RNA polymerase sigma-70 factor (ECF subfamily)
MPTYESLVREYHALVFHVARGVLRDSSAAEDAAQDVFLSFLQNPAALSRATNVKAFVCRSALNRALDMAKAGKRRERRESLAAERRAAMDPVEAAFRSELRMRVGELPEDQRQAIDLHYFRGLTLPETADAMAIPVGTVSSRISAALGRLRTALGAAAFVALLARLETELSACEACEAAPDGLRERLLRLGTGLETAEAGRAVARPGAKVAAVSLAALITVSGLIAWRVRAEEEATGGSAAATEDGGAGTAGGPAAETLPPPDGGGETAKAPLEPAPAAPVEGETVLEGFLVQTPEGLRVRPIDAWEHLPRQTMWDEDEWQEAARREAMVLANEEALAGIPPTSAIHFGEFLVSCGGPETAPQALVRVRVREREKIELPEPDRVEVEGLSIPVPSDRKAKATKVTVIAVLEKEILTHAWLEAWREMQRAQSAVGAAWALDPGLEKRAKVLEATTAFSEACARAREARAGQAAPWRIAREWECTWCVAGRIRAVGLGEIVASCPTHEELRAALQDGRTQESLRRSVVSKWGEEALALKTSYYAAYRSKHGQGITLCSTTFRAVLAMNEAEFAEFRGKLEDGERQYLEGLAESREHPEVKRLKEACAEVGLELAELTAIERGRYFLDHGALVIAVAAGSAAEKAGIQVGDVLWRATVPVESKRDVAPAACPIWNPGSLGSMIEGARRRGAPEIPIEAVRESGHVKLSLSL